MKAVFSVFLVLLLCVGCMPTHKPLPEETAASCIALPADSMQVLYSNIPDTLNNSIITYVPTHQCLECELMAAEQTYEVEKIPIIIVFPASAAEDKRLLHGIRTLKCFKRFN